MTPSGEKTVRIVAAQSEADLAEAARLMRAFLAWCRVRYADRPWHVEQYYAADALDAELARLSEAYAAPACILLARIDGAAAGCVALRPMHDDSCEMKRLYVVPEFHGLGVGRALVAALFDRARAAGFRTMRLDTGDKQPEAIALYHAMGFRDIAPYHALPPDILPHMIFMERAL
jgi:GNAT superfamily N-acetyltransferase